MTLPREAWPRLKEAFEGARALALDARPAYLAEVCNGDEALRHEVELLLAHDDQAASFLETPAMPFDDSLVAKSLEGQCIGPYQVSALIGTGGMGEVYRARDTKLNRLVAIKVLLPALANDPDRLARFSREAQLLASLNHPHIAQIHGFENAGGLHALVMELVEGPTLADRIAQGADSHRRGAGDGEADRRGARGGARARDHPSGPEAREHQGSRGRHGEGAGLRAGEGHRLHERATVRMRGARRPPARLRRGLA